MIGEEDPLTDSDMRVPISRARNGIAAHIRRTARPGRASPIDGTDAGSPVLDSESASDFENVRIRPDGGIPSGSISDFYAMWYRPSNGRYYTTIGTTRAVSETPEVPAPETPRTNGYEEFDIEDDDMPF